MIRRVYLRALYAACLLALLSAALGLLGGCAPSPQELALIQPAPVKLPAGAASPAPGRLVAAVADKALLSVDLSTGNFNPMPLPSNWGGIVAPAAGFVTWSQDGNVAVFPFLHYQYLDRYLLALRFSNMTYTLWAGTAGYTPWVPVPLAAAWKGEIWHSLSALYRKGEPRKVTRLAYDVISLEPLALQTVGSRLQKVAQIELPVPWDLPRDRVLAAALSPEGLVWTVAAAGTVYRWDVRHSQVLDKLLTPEQAAKYLGSPAAARASRQVVYPPARNAGPVFVAYWPAPGAAQAVHLWRLPLTGPAQYAGALPLTTPEGNLLQATPRPDGQAWAEIRGAAPAAAAASSPAAESAPGNSLWTTTAPFQTRAAVQVAGADPHDPVWSVDGKTLYFVLNQGEIWSCGEGESAQKAATAPPLAAFQKPLKRRPAD